MLNPDPGKKDWVYIQPCINRLHKKNFGPKKFHIIPKKFAVIFVKLKFLFKAKITIKRFETSDPHSQHWAWVLSQNMDVLDWEKGSYISLAVLTGIFVDIYKML